MVLDLAPPLLSVIAGLAATQGCVELLEMEPEGEAAEPSADALVIATTPAVLPSAAPTDEGRGLVVPATPGLRVPEGYWARVRLDEADLLLTSAWAHLEATEGGAMLRVMAARGEDSAGRPAGPTVRAVIPLDLPDGTALGALEGLDLGADALREATVAIATSPSDTWLVEPARLTLEHLDERLVAGTLEGEARRGKKGRRLRAARLGFLALRAPGPAPPDTPMEP